MAVPDHPYRRSVSSAVELYAAGLASTDAPLVLRYPDGSGRVLPVRDWTAQELDGDASLLDRCTGPVLDVGCGPGRLTVAADARGLPALGVDITPAAVQLAHSRGGLALNRSVFDRLPGRGRWAGVLLADGNIGIGGDPVGLLRRLAELLAPSGLVLVELESAPARSGPVRVRVEHKGRTSEEFGWAHVAEADAARLAEDAGLLLVERWTVAGRCFVALGRPAPA